MKILLSTACLSVIFLAISCHKNYDEPIVHKDDSNKHYSGVVDLEKSQQKNALETKKEIPEDKLKNEISYKLAIHFVDVEKIFFEKGFLKVTLFFNPDRIGFESNNIEVPVMDTGEKEPAAKAYLYQVSTVLKAIYSLRKELKVTSVSMESSASLETENRWGETRSRKITMLKAAYGHNNLKKIFTAWENGDDINIRTSANSFYGRLTDPTR